MMSLSALKQRYRVAENPLQSERRVELLLLLLGVVLVLQLLYSVARSIFPASPETVLPPAEVLSMGSIASVEIVSAEQSHEIKARPLFWTSRRPLEPVPDVIPEVTTAPGAAESKKLKKVKLLGLFGEGKSAGFIAMVKGEKKRILVGGEVEGWTLDSIGRDRALLTSAGRTEELLLAQIGVMAPAETKDQVVETMNTAAVKSSEKNEGRVAPGAIKASGDDAPVKPQQPKTRSLTMGIRSDNN